MKTEIIKNIIDSVGNNALFVGKADEKRILEIEGLLEVKLPNSYKWFLKEYGHGGINGFDILGNGLAPLPSCVRATLNWRKHGLPKNFVVLEDTETDWMYCIDTSKMENGECPVVDWGIFDGLTRTTYDTFFDYFIYMLEEYKDL